MLIFQPKPLWELRSHEAFLTWSSAEMAAGKLPENDNRLLLSGRDFVDSTVGYAPLSSMCDVSRSGEETKGVGV